MDNIILESLGQKPACFWCGQPIEGEPVRYSETLQHWIFCSDEHRDLAESNRFDLFSEDWHFKPGQAVDCFKCHWAGELRQAKQVYVHSSPESWRVLAGREGFEYACPSCGWIVHRNYTRMS